MSSHLINYASGLVGQYYQTTGNTKLAIWAAGAPGLPSNASDDAKLLASGGFDLLRPDYYGLARSAGYFSAKGSIQTMIDSVKVMSTRDDCVSIYADTTLIPPIYDEIVLIGGSYGGRVTIASALLPEIEEIVLLYPRLWQDDMNQLGHPEESDEDFLRQYTFQKHMYRIHPDSDASEALLDIQWAWDGSIDHLYDKKVFIWHGTADDCVWSGRSDDLYQRLLDLNPKGSYHYASYYGLWHDNTKTPALHGWLYWRRQFE